MQKVKITSDGLPHNTHVFIDGKELRKIQSIDYSINLDGSRLIITMVDVELELEGEFYNKIKQDQVATNVVKQCTCKTVDLISKGCQCGGG